MPCRARRARTIGCTIRGAASFVCISPWNFPLAIFIGQIAAALVAGNQRLAKPAEQTPLIAAKPSRCCIAAAFPDSVSAPDPGDGETGAALVA